MLRGDPSLVVCARIKLPTSPYLHHICYFRYNTTFIHVLHLLMRSIHLYITFTYVLHSFFFFHVFAMYMLYLLMRCTHLCVALTHALHLLMHRTYLFVALISCITFIQWCIALIDTLYSFIYCFVYVLRYISFFMY